MNRKLKLGLIGCSQVAAKRFIPAALLAEPWQIAAFAAQNLERAQKFATDFGGIAAPSYEALLALPDIDAVYISLPNALHSKWILQALRAGKHVLCEKPLVTNLESALEISEEARTRGLLVFENYMFVEHPQHAVVQELIKAGRIGELKSFTACFSIPPLPPTDIRYDASLGGGTLFDNGGYPIRAMSLFLGTDLQCQGAILENENRSVDIRGSALFRDQFGRIASLHFGLNTYYQNFYELLGTHGKIRVERAFTHPPDWEPQIELETPSGVERVTAPKSNHFTRTLERFALELREPKYHDSRILSFVEQAKLRADVLKRAHAQKLL